VPAALQLTRNRSRRLDVPSCSVDCDGKLYGPAPGLAMSSPAIASDRLPPDRSNARRRFGECEITDVKDGAFC